MSTQPTIPCIGICKGVPGWIDPETKVACTVCHGSGLLKPSATWAEEYESVRRATMHRRDVRPIGPPAIGRRKRGASPEGRERRHGRRKRKAMRQDLGRARRLAMDAEFRAFRASRPPDWDAQLDRLKLLNRPAERKR